VKKIIFYLTSFIAVVHGIGAIVLFWLGAFENKICSYSDRPCLADWTSRGLFVLFLAVIFVCFVGAMQENKWNS